MSDYSDGEESGGFDDVYDSDASFDGDALEDDEVPAATSKGKEKVGQIEYMSLSAHKLQEVVDEEIRDVSNILVLDPNIASIMLQHYRWNRDRLIEKYMDLATAVLHDVGEPLNAPLSPSLVRPSKRARLDTPAADSSAFECPICCDTETPAFRLRCGHAFCEGCWAAYAQTKVRDEGQCLFACMQDGCRTVVDEPALVRLLDGPAYTRYKELLLQSYVSTQTSLRFCPHPGCGETVRCGARGSALLSEVPTVRCGAGHAFCFGCGLDSDHRPLICRLVALWTKNAREDSGTSQWIKANTRTCPRCQNNIEKAGGCNRILCRQCQYQFCWLCMQNWDVHGYNDKVCSTWKEPDPDQAATEAKTNLEKWLFYFDRFNNHELSSRLDNELLERTEEKMIEVQEQSNLSWIEAKFMRNAVDELTQCRRTLKWSYAMAYFLKQGNQKQIFEDLQANLEKAVEDLAELLEEPIDTDTVKSLRQRMMDKTVYVHRRHEILLEDSAEGLSEGTWEWGVPLE